MGSSQCHRWHLLLPERASRILLPSTEGQPGDTLFPRSRRWPQCTCAHKTLPPGGSFWISPDNPTVKGTKGRITTPHLPAAEVFPYGCCSQQPGPNGGNFSTIADWFHCRLLDQGVSIPLQPQPQDLEAKASTTYILWTKTVVPLVPLVQILNSSLAQTFPMVCLRGVSISGQGPPL